MANDNETVEQACESIYELVIAIHDKEHNEKQEIKNAWHIVQQVKDRFLAAHKRETGDLRCRLKVVEDALGESRIAICHICNIKHTCGHGTAKFDPCCIIKDIDSAIAAIRGVGGAE